MKATLYYDGNCPLCAKEIALLRRLNRGRLELTDIHKAQTLAKPNYEMLEILHYQTANGQWLLGLDATVAAWSHTRIGFLFKPLRWIGVKSLADRVYTRWASQRSCRLGYKTPD